MKLNYLKTSALIISSILLVSCGGQMDAEANAQDDYGAYESYDYLEELTEVDDYANADEAIATENYNNNSQPIPQIERKLIKTASLTYEVEDLKATTEKVHASLALHNGYLSSENEYSSYDRNTVNISLRVPSNNFDAFLADVTQGVGYFDSKDISTQDVTEEFIDVKARIKTKKEVEAQYVALLDKAVSIGEVMEIERQIGYIREEIEVAEGRLKYLQNSTSYSTISLSYYKLVEEPSKYGKKFSNSFDLGWDGFVNFFVVLTALWPFAILAIITLFIIRAYRKKSKKKNKF